MQDQPSHPKHTMLLLMDFQRGILESLTRTHELLPRLVGTIQTARECGVAIGYVRVAFTDADYEAMARAGERWRTVAATRRLHDGTPETAIHDDLAPQPGDLVVRKTRIGAFSTNDLDRQLHRRGIDTLILAGVATGGVVLSTICDAADRDYRLFVLADCCADRDQDVHHMLTHKVFPRRATVITAANIATLWHTEQ